MIVPHLGHLWRRTAAGASGVCGSAAPSRCRVLVRDRAGEAPRQERRLGRRRAVLQLFSEIRNIRSPLQGSEVRRDGARACSQERFVVCTVYGEGPSFSSEDVH